MRHMCSRTKITLGNDISNIAYDDFLVSEVDYGKKIIEEACLKHPLNPREVPRQKPGEDLAPIPVVNDTKLSNEAIQKQKARAECIQAQNAKPQPKDSTQASHSQEKIATVLKKPVAPINSTRSAQIQQQAALGDDKKYKCHLCGKMFRVLLALKNHMVIRHDGAEVQLPAEGEASGNSSTPTPTSATPSPNNISPRISLSSIDKSVSTEITSKERATLRESLLDMWDSLGKEKWGREKYQHCRFYTEKEIRTLAETAKSGMEGIRTAQESGFRQSTQPRPMAAAFNPPKAIPVSNSKAPPDASTSQSIPGGTFNPFASLVSDDGTPPQIFDTSASTATQNNTPVETQKGKAPVEIIVDGEKKYQCTICGKAFKTQLGLTGHFETKHPGQATGVATSGTTTEGGRYAIPINLEDIPAYVPTPVDMSKFPGQGAGEIDPKGAALAEELRNATVSLEQDVVVHARACTNITLSGVVIEMKSGYQGLIPVLQFTLLVEGDVLPQPQGGTEETKQAEQTVHPPETVVVRVYGSALVKRAQTSIREGNLVLVIGLLKLNPVPLGARCYHNPYVTVSDGGGTVLALM